MEEVDSAGARWWPLTVREVTMARLWAVFEWLASDERRWGL